MVNLWIEKNIKELYKICKSVCKCKKQEYMDLLQMCVEQIITNPKFNDLDDKQKLYFFTKVVRNNYWSQSSPYWYKIKKHKFQELPTKTYDMVYELYEETQYNLQWVNKQLKQLKQTNLWYYGRIFELYIEENCNLTKLSKRTTIPIQSLSKDINKVRRILNKRKEI